MNNNSKSNNRSKNSKVKREQPRKDSRSKRVNFDNESEQEFDAKYKRRSNKDPRDTKQTSKSNDVRWYANNPELLRSAASLPFSTVTGNLLPWGSNVGNYIGSVPGVLSLLWRPSLGGQYIDAVNQAKDSIYSFTVHANSRNTSYTAEDEMLLIIAGAQVFAFIANAIRAYGTMLSFDQRNKYLPRGLIKAMGFDYDDLQTNLNQMWFDINEVIARSRQIWIPNDLPFVERWFWMNSNIYMDASSPKAQYYVFCEDGAFKYDEMTSNKGGQLVRVNFDLTAGGSSAGWGPTQPRTWAQYMKGLNEMINALINSEDRGLIFGDILKAYGADKIYALSPIPAGYTVTPVYDIEVLSQIENATTCAQGCIAIVQNPDTAKIEEQYVNKVIEGGNLGGLLLPNKAVLNFHQLENPTPEQIMVATRLMSLGSTPYPSLNDEGTASFIPTTCGTEVITDTQAVFYNGNGVLTSAEFPCVSFMNDATATAGSAKLGVHRVMLRAAFDWCPWTYYLSKSPFSKDTNQPAQVDNPIWYAIGDYDNWTTIDVETLRKMHQTAVYSEFGVPTL